MCQGRNTGRCLESMLLNFKDPHAASLVFLETVETERQAGLEKHHVGFPLMSHFTSAPRHAVRKQRHTLTMISQWRCVNSGGAILLVKVSDFQKIFSNGRFKVEKLLNVALIMQYCPYWKGWTRRKQQKPTAASERHQGGIIFPFVKFPKTKRMEESAVQLTRF